MALARVYGAAMDGEQGRLVEVEAHMANGEPAFVLVGLDDSVLREARDRVRAAIVNSGQEWPLCRITVGLTPAKPSRRDSSLDLAIAVSVLAADGVVPNSGLTKILFLAELGLGGWLRPVPDIDALLSAAVDTDVNCVVLATANAAEAVVTATASTVETEEEHRIRVVGVDNLIRVIDMLRSE